MVRLTSTLLLAAIVAAPALARFMDEPSLEDLSMREFDEYDLEARNYDKYADFEARDYYEGSDDVYGREYDEFSEVDARDYEDLEDVDARDYEDLEDVDARDYDDFVDFEARENTFDDFGDLSARDYLQEDVPRSYDSSDEEYTRSYDSDASEIEAREIDELLERYNELTDYGTRDVSDREDQLSARGVGIFSTEYWERKAAGRKAAKQAEAATRLKQLTTKAGPAAAAAPGMDAMAGAGATDPAMMGRGWDELD